MLGEAKTGVSRELYGACNSLSNEMPCVLCNRGGHTSRSLAVS